MNKPLLSAKVGKDFVEVKCVPHELQWIERWLENFMRSKSLPPQCAGKDAFNACIKFLAPSDFLMMLEHLRSEFLLIHPRHMPQMEDFSFLLENSENVGSL